MAGGSSAGAPLPALGLPGAGQRLRRPACGAGLQPCAGDSWEGAPCPPVLSSLLSTHCPVTRGLVWGSSVQCLVCGEDHSPVRVPGEPPPCRAG